MKRRDRDVQYLLYLKLLIKNLKVIKTKMEKKKDLDDDDREVIKATIEAFLKMDREI